MDNLTYYLGAGASANIIPTYENRILFIDQFEKFIETFFKQESPDYLGLHDTILQLCLEIIEESKLYMSFDKFALQLSKGPNIRLAIFKVILGHFIEFTQLFKNDFLRHSVDKRYTDFSRKN